MDESGKITAQKGGEALIMAKTVDEEKFASCIVYVTETYNVLHIGNSFTQDAVDNHYADLIGESGFVDKVSVSCLHYGVKTLNFL
ncbi:hypothetical protein [Proteiniphilum sp. UBA5384]|uniref:hypothetical protein n=1 Tax=Proteiniphilum sp. UBA5384 TaxID=1947279 RepID=UPI0025E28C88|nr:hypothetical protein [Proteiniphilum sp. UBA5384]